jgi:hypothetical protein
MIYCFEKAQHLSEQELFALAALAYGPGKEGERWNGFLVMTIPKSKETPMAS